MTLELETTRAPGGAMTTRTPGVPATGYGDMFKTLIDSRVARQNQPKTPVMPRQAAPRGPSPYSAEAQNAELQQIRMSQQRMPTMGTQQSAPKSEEDAAPSRMIRDPYWNPNDSVYWGAGRLFDSGIRPKMVKERFIGGQWEFDNVDPSRHGSGGAPRIEDNTARDAMYKQAGMDAQADKMAAQVEANRRAPIMPAIQPVPGGKSNPAPVKPSGGRW